MRAEAMLYPATDAYDQQMLDVGDGHQVYVEQSGNPDGIPIVVLHGGPGGGCSPFMRRFFNPELFRTVLFDQRGCGKSKPHSCLEANTTWHLVRDIELIRETLGIDRWHLFGGSWGSTLALIYGQSHPERVRSMILRGIFLMTQSELDWFYNGGAARFWPDAWAQLVALLPEDERADVVAGYRKRLTSGDLNEETRFAKAWSGWENALASISSTGEIGSAPDRFAHAFARLENHYFSHMGWLDDDTAILNRMERLSHIPGVIIQGRQDVVCPPKAAHDLASLWPRARLRMIPAAGHTMSEPPIARALLQETDRLAQMHLDRQ